MTAVTVKGKGMYDLVCVAQRGHEYRGEPAHFIPCTTEGKTNSITTVQKDNLILQRPHGKNSGGAYVGKAPTLTSNSWQQNNHVTKGKVRQLNPSRESGGTQPYQQNRVYDPEGQAPALMNGHGGQTINALVGGEYTYKTSDGYRVRQIADNSRLVQMGVQRNPAIPYVRQWMDG